jgi:LPS O-antigen subunit length determinant protein (WzzB/FepE family)
LGERQMRDFILALSSLIGLIAGSLIVLIWRKR